MGPRVFSEDDSHLESLGCEATSVGDWWKSNEEEVDAKENAGGGGGTKPSSSSDNNYSECYSSTTPPDAVSLVPLVQWYDSTHIASTAYYRNFVFDRRVKRVTKGGFIEDKLGQQQLKVCDIIFYFFSHLTFLSNLCLFINE